MKTIRIAIAAIKQGDKFHYQLRNHKSSTGGTNLIGYFGGVIEEGEEPLVAIVRELGEETSLRPKPEECKFLGTVQVESDYHKEMVRVETYMFSIELDDDEQFSTREGELVSLSLEESAQKIDTMAPATAETFRKYFLKG